MLKRHAGSNATASGWRHGSGAERRWPGRPRRVMILLAGIVVLSLADLIITLTHLEATGMPEANPVARFVIEATGSPLSLTSFKLLSVLVCVVMLYKVRRHVQAEIAAWCALLILTVMSFMWFTYSRQVDEPTETTLAQMRLKHPDWVQFN